LKAKGRKSCEQCALVRDLATKIENRELFNRLSKHLNILAAEVEKAIAGARRNNELKRA
jgi:hypothetical protein